MTEKYEQIAAEMEALFLSDTYLTSIDKYIYGNANEVVFYTDRLSATFINCFSDIIEKYNMLWRTDHNDDNRYNFRLVFWIRR